MLILTLFNFFGILFIVDFCIRFMFFFSNVALEYDLSSLTRE